MQVAGIGTLEPRGQRKPGPHGRHSVAPPALWYVLSGQSEQSELRMPAAKLPALQLIGAIEPATQNAPDGQSRHSEASRRLVMLEWVPASAKAETVVHELWQWLRGV